MKSKNKSDEKKYDDLEVRFISKVSKDIELALNVRSITIDSIKNMLKGLKDKELDIVLEKLINIYLDNLKQYMTLDRFKDIKQKVDEVTDYYYVGKDSDQFGIIEDGDALADELLLKVLGRGNIKLELPISLKDIKTYCLHSSVNKKDVHDILIWAVIRFIAIDRCMLYGKSDKEYKELLVKNN